MPHRLELLAPAKNLEYGRQAINHGADALYIGAPAFGARQAATNSMADIEALVRYAHLYACKVFATVNTLLFDHELEQAVQMIHQLYQAGVDALIVQDLGLLQCDLPPIELHASTQCHNFDIERIKSMEQAGFKRIILARECSIDEIQAIRQSVVADLEAFCHGALCVSYSGQCYMSQYLNRRSGNRGQCSQPCRSAYDLRTTEGRTLLRNKHLLSLRDFNASQALREMAEAGITSFKIEGRLKDLDYVKNITAYYRQLLDAMMCERPSVGTHTFHFVPDVERTFNRGYTTYFLHGRQPMASIDTQKSRGKQIGKVVGIGRNSIEVAGNEPLTAGDGLCYLDTEGHLQGFFVNQVQGNTIIPNRMPTLTPGTILWRNHDQAFAKQLQSLSATRKIALELHFRSTPTGFELHDAQGHSIGIDLEHTPSNNPDRNSCQIIKQLSKLGDTPFAATQVVDHTHGAYFLPAASLNALRRDFCQHLAHTLAEEHRPADCYRQPSSFLFQPQQGIDADYRLNVVNNKAEEFYNKHGIKVLERGLEQTGNYADHALMTTRYCLRYELGCCLKGKSHHTPLVDIKPTDKLQLHNNGRIFDLHFDCTRCQMQVLPVI